MVIQFGHHVVSKQTRTNSTSFIVVPQSFNYMYVEGMYLNHWSTEASYFLQNEG